MQRKVHQTGRRFDEIQSIPRPRAAEAAGVEPSGANDRRPGHRRLPAARMRGFRRGFRLAQDRISSVGWQTGIADPVPTLTLGCCGQTWAGDRSCGAHCGLRPPPFIPPPPPITLKFFGFENEPGEPRKVFLSQGEDVFIAGEGEIVNRRYRVLHIGQNSVEMEDVLNNNRQNIPLTQG